MTISSALIIGAGPSGIALALALHRLGINVQIFEVRPSPSTIGGAINLTPTALRYLDTLKVLPKLLEVGAGVSSIELWSLTSHSRLGAFDYSNPRFNGYQGLRIKREDFMRCMLSTLSSAGVEVTWGKKLTTVHEHPAANQIEASFVDGTTATGDVLFGCDGIHSLVRTSYVDPARQPSYTGAAVASGFLAAHAVKTAPHFKDASLNSGPRGSLIASYSDRARQTLYLGAIMPIAQQGGKDGWRAMGAEKDKLKQYAREQFFPSEKPVERVGCLKEIVENVEELILWPVNLLSLEGRWSKGRAMLVGDAAHAMPPQGESTGFAVEDAVLVAHVMQSLQRKRKMVEGGDEEDKATGEEVAGIWTRYEELRKPRMRTAWKDATFRWNSNTHGKGWLGGVVQEWIMPVFLWWTKGRRERELGEDVRELVV